MEVLDRMPWAAKDSVFRKLSEIAEVSNMSKEDRIKYDSALRHYRDTISVLQAAEDKGIEKGKAQGLEEGKLQGSRENNIKNAKKMKVLGVTKDIIQQVTGLKPKEIDNL